MSILFTLLLTAAPASATAMPEPNPAEMSAAEIRAHNKQLDRKDPYFIKCVREADTGSLVGRKPVCRTNERWAVLEKVQRAGADQLARDMTTNSHSSGN
ncbi:hypothetical protein [Novosphingobium ginsenosidimutans]|uniref:Secreted protein n=1 Tax=Novosphingobium ginsenosidimutans TaxID=1176536 RepID=A0A5B8S3I8_9SPHN|nr:hypothetical protein [Novosphingobium ginsenosidimutans]QEA15694.1 hypothetical protein FRF71_05835 [Novosphingobium ginsenosidimutans]